MQKKLIPLLASLFLALPALAAPTLEMEIGQDKATLGKVTLELYPEKAPKTVEMFLYNAKQKMHDIFDRETVHNLSIPIKAGKMIQNDDGSLSLDITKKQTKGKLKWQ